MKKKIKILIITHSFPTKSNPVGAIFILNQLIALKKSCEIKVIFPYVYIPKVKIFDSYYKFIVPSKEEIEGISIYHPKYLMFPRIFFVRRFLNIFLVIESLFSYLASKKVVDDIIKNWNPDIVHLHGPLKDGLIGIRIKRKYKKPLLVTVHGEDITLFSKKIFSNYLTKYTLKNSDAIICQSKFLQNEINSIGIYNKKFFIIPMGALTSIFSPRVKTKARKILGLPKEKKIILFVGHLIPRKGVEYLIRAIRLILKKDKDILCCIIGSGHLEDSLKNLTQNLGLNGYIKFLGQKKHDYVALYMNACDILVLPSLNEGLPVVLCEALACGKPVVATSVAGTPELVNKDVGYLVKPADVTDLAKKIILALNKKWEKEKLLKRAKEFSVTNSAKKLINVYKSVLKVKNQSN